MRHVALDMYNSCSIDNLSNMALGIHSLCVGIIHAMINIEMSKLVKSINVCRSTFNKAPIWYEWKNEETFQSIIDADPEGGKNCNWFITQLINQYFRPEDLSRVRDDVALFFKNRKSLPVDQRVLAKYTYRQLKDIIEQFEQIEDWRYTYRDDEVDVIYRGIEGLLISPLTESASCQLGAGTKWCTAARKNNMFEQYNQVAPLYIWIDNSLPKGKNKFQFWFSDEVQIMDIKDNPVENEMLRYLLEHPIVGPWMNDEMIKAPPSELVRIAKNINERLNDELESAILADMDSVIQYANQVVRGRWLEAEQRIMEHPQDAYTYATRVIRGR